MKIGLIDVDSHRWPNLCLMKLSAYHKAQGADVEWWSPKGRYDLVYKSRVFTDTYSKDRITVTNADKLICGGTGYGPGQNLAGCRGAYPPRLWPLSAGPGHSLWLSHKGLSPPLRLLHNSPEGGGTERPHRRPLRVLGLPREIN